MAIANRSGSKKTTTASSDLGWMKWVCIAGIGILVLWMSYSVVLYINPDFRFRDPPPPELDYTLGLANIELAGEQGRILARIHLGRVRGKDGALKQIEEVTLGSEIAPGWKAQPMADLTVKGQLWRANDWRTDDGRLLPPPDPITYVTYIVRENLKVWGDKLPKGTKVKILWDEKKKALVLQRL